MQSEAVASVEETQDRILRCRDAVSSFDLNQNEIKHSQATMPMIEITPASKPIEKKKRKRSKVTNLAQVIVLEFNKATFRFRENLSSRAKTANMPKKGHHRHALNVDLFNQISSLVVTPVDGGSMLMSSRRSAPDLLAYRLSFRRDMTLLDLDDNLLHRILQYGNGNDVHTMSQTCRRLRRIAQDKISSLNRKKVSNYEIVVERNNHSDKVTVRALKKYRSVVDPIFESTSLTDITPRTLHCFTKITFGSGVDVKDWAPELLKLYKEGRLTPNALTISGGSSHSGGADLRGFTEIEFVTFIGHFHPHIEEVQIATNRLFKTSTSQPYLLSLIPILNYFGVIYERPCLRYNFEDVKHIIKHWQTQSHSENCEVFIRRPSAACRKSWMSLGAVIEGETNRVHRVTVPHAYINGIELVFNLH